MPAITAKIIKGVPHFTVVPFATKNKGTETVTLNAVEDDNRARSVVLKFVNVESEQAARDIAANLGWIVEDPV